MKRRAIIVIYLNSKIVVNHYNLYFQWSFNCIDMEQTGVSIISPPGVTENSVGKSKSIGITLRSSSLQSAKEKLKAPCEYKLMVQL